MLRTLSGALCDIVLHRSFQFGAFGGSGREDQLPHLEYNENLTQFDLNIDHIMTDLSKARFAVELIMLGNGMEDMKLDETKSIDDEYTPGVFRVATILNLSKLKRLPFAIRHSFGTVPELNQNAEMHPFSSSGTIHSDLGIIC